MQRRRAQRPRRRIHANVVQMMTVPRRFAQEPVKRLPSEPSRAAVLAYTPRQARQAPLRIRAPMDAEATTNVLRRILRPTLISLELVSSLHHLACIATVDIATMARVPRQQAPRQRLPQQRLLIHVLMDVKRMETALWATQQPMFGAEEPVLLPLRLE